ncbi:SRPBCC family protein [Blastococcus litoris]|uniref:SRPBCC family protein n=1 Tax=Blastococcus litoris TaxID=2171622 RepID=UPI000E309A25|nr:SRPBCC family protein [Blastococcus litoris]
MSRDVQRVRLPGTATEVAGLVLDWSRDAEWRPTVVAMVADPPGRARVGQRITEELRTGGRTYVTPTTITDADELTASFAGGTSTLVVEGRRTVVPEPDGGCTVVLEVDVRMTGLRAVLNPVLARMNRQRLAREAAALAQATSSTARSAEPTSRA